MKSFEVQGVPIIPTAISLAGVALSIDGARRVDTVEGLAEICVGRGLDLVDGAVARALNQTSEFGAIADAFSDKAAGLAMLVSEWRKDIAPKPILAAMFAQNTANGVATYIAKRKSPELELTRSVAGARAMFMQNISILSYAVGNLIKDTEPQQAKTFRVLGHIAAGVGVGYFGVPATLGYFKRAANS